MADTPSVTGIPEIDGDLTRLAPRRRAGRKALFDEPTVTTTIRVTMEDWRWVKQHPGAQFSALLRAKVHELKLRELSPPDPKAEFVKAARAVGFRDERIAQLVRELAP